MMTALVAAAPRIGKFVRLLASDRPGEILAAVATLGRTLAAYDLDHHVLASAVEIGLGRYQHRSERHRQAEQELKPWQQIAQDLLRRT